ncbi:MAG: hypothetical protein IJD56_08450 [Peptococcaceae bacterium]|nr:hypothetical protein [Peptococcaceae bacterium]
MAPIISQEMVYYIRHTEEEQAELRKWKEELEHSIVPCDKSLDEFKQLLIDELGMCQVEWTEHELNRHKAVYIENHHRDWLKTPEVSLPKDRPPTEEEHSAWRQSRECRHTEAMQIPMEQTGLVFRKFQAEYVQETEQRIDITVILEESSYTYEVHSGKNGKFTAEEKEKIDAIVERILLYKGVSAEDIRTKSQAYQEYMSLLINRQMRKGVKLKDYTE